MTCETMRDRLLEAGLDALQGRGDSDVARHVRACARCGAAAQRIVHDEETLAHALRDVTPAAPAPTAVARAARRAAGDARRRTRWRRAIPALAAAALAGLLIARNGAPPVEPPAPAAARPEPALDVATVPGQHVAIIHTDNPNIVIVWAF